jgi:hypothetical protein
MDVTRDPDAVIEIALDSLQKIHEADTAELAKLESQRPRCICTDCPGRVARNLELQALRNRLQYTEKIARRLMALV